MRYLQILNIACLIAGASMTLVLSVVTLIMALYQEEAAQVGGSFAGVAAATVVFALFGLAAAAAVWGMRRGAAWRWIAQGVLFAVIALLVTYLRNLA
ncbi:hypothetical protein PC39_09095 [Salinisphaera sp. PC39]|uniref:hypothetical protein n=1 Tax=Salinisphaera sp. PC39 TaxID=1304156 RepID=UPI003341009D